MPIQTLLQPVSTRGQAIAQVWGWGQGGAEVNDSLLPSFPDHGDPLTVFRPGNVLDLPSKRLVLIL